MSKISGLVLKNTPILQVDYYIITDLDYNFNRENGIAKIACII